MDEDILAPMADALSATLAVFILLICFFVMAQVDAVSRQIKAERIGMEEVFTDSVLIDFDEGEYKNNQFVFYNSFNIGENVERISKVIDDVVADCKGCDMKMTSNYPLHGVTEKRAEKRALVNALKLAKVLDTREIKYEMDIITDYNYYFIELEAIQQ